MTVSAVSTAPKRRPSTPTDAGALPTAPTDLARIDDVDTGEVAATVGTPVYLYSAARMDRALQAYRSALDPLGVSIFYACKANGTLSIIRRFVAGGAGVDVVSEGEMRRALAAGCPADRIVFSGVGKTRSELAAACAAGIHQINVESAEELYALSAVASEMGVAAPVALRVNPDVDARTHAKISTGRKQDKFGIPIDRAVALYGEASRLPGIAAVGYAVHIGSQMIDVSPFRAAYTALADLTRETRAAGLTVERLDLGGGLGIAYDGGSVPDLQAYAGIIAETVGDLGCAIAIEPGRSLIGPAGLLLSRVVYVKQGAERPIVILDAAMNDLMRPALYDAAHRLMAVDPAVYARGALAPMDVVGPVCESSDTFARSVELPPLKEGDLVAFLDAGAYGASMASAYNARALVPEVLADTGRFAVVRNRPSLSQMLEWEPLAEL